MAAAPYILARTMKEAHEFARGDLGLTYGHYRIVNSPSTIKSVRGADLYLVPGHQNRFDRFAMKGAIRWTRMNVIDVEKDGLGVDPRGDLTPDLLEMAYAEHSVRSGNGAPGISTSSAPDGLTPPGVQTSMAFDDLFSEVGKPVVFAEQVQTAVVIPDETAEALDVPQPTLDGGEAIEPKPEEPAKKRRRTRCKDCGELHFKTDPCPTNDESA